MNNRTILLISVCGNLIFGLLIYGIFFSPDELQLNSPTFFGGILTGVSLNITAYSLYSQKRKKEVQ